MPVVSTKLSDHDFKVLKSLAEREGRTVASYVRLQVKPRLTNSSILSQLKSLPTTVVPSTMPPQKKAGLDVVKGTFV